MSWKSKTGGAYFEHRSDDFMVYACPGFDFPPHLHSQLELLYVVYGRVTVAAGERRESLSAGSLGVVFPNQVHSYQAQGESQVIMLICDTGYAGGSLDTLTRFHPACPFLPPERLHPNVAYAMEQLAEEYGISGKESPVYGPLVQLILARVLPELELGQNRSADYKSLTWRIAGYVNEHYREPISLDTLARAVGVSRCHLSRVFSEKMGQSFPSYLSNIRLSYARALLADTELSVTEIAGEAGFGSQRSFYRCFRERFGITPLEYRQKLAK